MCLRSLSSCGEALQMPHLTSNAEHNVTDGEPAAVAGRSPLARDDARTIAVDLQICFRLVRPCRVRGAQKGSP